MKKKLIIMLILFLSIGVVTLFMTQTIKFGGEQKGLAQKIQEVTNLEHRNSSYQMVFNAEPEICRDSSTYRCLGIASQREIENATFTLHWFYSDGTKIVKELINTEKDVIKKPVFISGNVYPDVFDDKNLHYHLFLMKCINDDVDADLILQKIELSGKFQINSVWYTLSNDIIYLNEDNRKIEPIVLSEN